MKAMVIAVTVALIAASQAAAHNGSLDSRGCHVNAARNAYECHQGPLQGQSFKSRAEAEARIAADARAARGKRNVPDDQTAKTPDDPRRR